MTFGELITATLAELHEDKMVDYRLMDRGIYDLSNVEYLWVPKNESIDVGTKGYIEKVTDTLLPKIGVCSVYAYTCKLQRCEKYLKELPEKLPAFLRKHQFMFRIAEIPGELACMFVLSSTPPYLQQIELYGLDTNVNAGGPACVMEFTYKPEAILINIS